MAQTSSSSINRGTTDYGGNNLEDTASSLADRASEQLGKVAENVDYAARSVAEQGRQAGEQVQAVAGNLKTALDKSIKEQPLTTLGVAIAVGFVVGAIWKA